MAVCVALILDIVNLNTSALTRTAGRELGVGSARSSRAQHRLHHLRRAEITADGVAFGVFELCVRTRGILAPKGAYYNSAAAAQAELRALWKYF